MRKSESGFLTKKVLISAIERRRFSQGDDEERKSEAGWV